ncbi:MAG TPA: sugar ABC transporter permease [Symbiobacteriaceae bacterium]|nr:sugar ABC transporter permease [Symbiobacteriaceae bacterium]
MRIAANTPSRGLRLWRPLQKHGPVFAMITPTVFLFLVAVVYPICWMLRYMFFDWDGVMPATFVGLENFVRLLTRDPLFWKSVMGTFVYAGGKLLLTLPASLLLAVALNRKLKGQNFFRGVLFMPTVISSAVASVVFFYMFNSYNGVINKLLLATHVVDKPINWFGVSLAMLTAILVSAWGAVGNYMVLILAGLQSIPPELYEAAAIDGADEWQQFKNVTIPMLGPVLQVVFMLAIVVALRGYEGIMVLTGGGPADATMVMFLYIFRLFFPSIDSGTLTQQYGYGAALSFVASIIITIITLGYLRLSRKLQDAY